MIKEIIGKNLLVNCVFFPLSLVRERNEKEGFLEKPALKDLWLTFSWPKTSSSMRLAGDNADGLLALFQEVLNVLSISVCMNVGPLETA